jgi:sulfide:quinone oxidoreductase
MARVLILGGGFAGITAAEILAAGMTREHEITLVSPSRRFTFYPALVPMVFDDFESSDVSVDMVEPLQKRGIRFVSGEVFDIDPLSRTVSITGSDLEGKLHYDKLLIAVGRRLATEKVPGFFEYAHHLLGVKAAQSFKQSISEFQEGAIVLGVCPDGRLPIPVCESALALAARFQKEIAEKTVSITAVFPETLDSALAGSGLFRDIENAFAAKGINLVSNFPINYIDDKSVLSDGQGSLPFDLLMLVPPFRGQTPVQHLSSELDSNGFASVNGKMQVDGFDGIYAAGDIVALPGPRFGYMAMRQAKVAAVNLLVELSDETPLLEYEHKVEWLIGEKHTHPYFFHYGVWDNTLADFDENALLGMAKRLRKYYGSVADGSETPDPTGVINRGTATK